MTTTYLSCNACGNSHSFEALQWRDCQFRLLVDNTGEILSEENLDTSYHRAEPYNYICANCGSDDIEFEAY